MKEKMDKVHLDSLSRKIQLTGVDRQRAVIMLRKRTRAEYLLDADAPLDEDEQEEVRNTTVHLITLVFSFIVGMCQLLVDLVIHNFFVGTGCH